MSSYLKFLQGDVDGNREDLFFFIPEGAVHLMSLHLYPKEVERNFDRRPDFVNLSVAWCVSEFITQTRLAEHEPSHRFWYSISCLDEKFRLCRESASPIPGGGWHASAWRGESAWSQIFDRFCLSANLKLCENKSSNKFFYTRRAPSTASGPPPSRGRLINKNLAVCLRTENSDLVSLPLRGKVAGVSLSDE